MKHYQFTQVLAILIISLFFCIPAFSSNIDMIYSSSDWLPDPIALTQGCSYTTMASDGAASLFMYAAKPAGGVDIIRNDFGVWSISHEIENSPTSATSGVLYNALAADGLAWGYVYAAKASGGIDIIRNDNGAWTASQEVAAVTQGKVYTALAADSQVWGFCYAAKSTGGVEIIRNDLGAWSASKEIEYSPSGATSGVVYSALASDGKVWGFVYAAKANGGVDIIRNDNGAWTASPEIISANGRKYTALAADSSRWGCFYGAKADGGIDMIYNDNGPWLVVTLPKTANYYYKALGSDPVNAQYLYGLSAPAKPMKTIAYKESVNVDGDLSDWNDADWQPINVNYDGNAIDISEAYSAIRWGANGSKVYVAVKVHDSAHFFTDSYSNWYARDAVEIFLHTTGGDVGPHGINDYSQYQEQAQQWTVGITNTNRNAVWSTCGFPASYGDYTPSSSEIIAAGRENGEWLYYEAAITPYEYFGGRRGNPSIVSTLKAGDVIGCDVVVVANNNASLPSCYGLYGYSGMLCERSAGGLSTYWDTFQNTQLVRAGEPASISNAKTKTPGSYVGVTGSITAVFDGSIYVETDDRVAGIRVDKPNHNLTTSDVGSIVSVDGSVAIDSSTNEVYINADNITPSGATKLLAPLGLTNKSVGGGSFIDSTSGTGQASVNGGTGLNNVGLLVRTTGTASNGDASGFTLSDGSGVDLKVSFSGANSTYDGKYVTVTGISSIGSNGVRVIKARTIDDVNPVN